MKFQEIFNEPGLYVADGFAKGFAFKIDEDGILQSILYSDKDDLFPIISNLFVYAGLFNKDYKKVFTRQSLFN